MVEWRSVALGAVIVAMFGGLTAWHAHLPVGVFIVALGWCSAWWTSFQHELIHGHPTPDRRVNDALGLVSPVLWLPYARYRSSHLRHHRNEVLTDPFDDPESYYESGEAWAAMGPLQRQLMWMNRTLLGRLVLGPWISVTAFLRGELVQLWRGRPGARRLWALHVTVQVPMLVWVFGICRIPVWQYLVSAVWIGTSLTMLRSFAEHRWVTGEGTRSAVVKAAWPWALLYLNNNLHHAHHARPTVAWYELPAVADDLESHSLAAAGAGLYLGYSHLARLYLVRPFCLPVHPSAPEAEELRVLRPVVS